MCWYRNNASWAKRERTLCSADGTREARQSSKLQSETTCRVITESSAKTDITKKNSTTDTKISDRIEPLYLVERSEPNPSNEGSFQSPVASYQVNSAWPSLRGWAPHCVPAQAGKVTAGQASHWPCVADTVVYPATGLRQGDEHPAYVQAKKKAIWLRRWFDFELDCNWTALRPIDDGHYHRRPTSCGLLRRSVKNKWVTVTSTSGLRHSDLNDLWEAAECRPAVIEAKIESCNHRIYNVHRTV